MPGPAVGRVLDDVAVLLEEAGQAAGEALVVLDEKQVHRSFTILRCARWRQHGDGTERRRPEIDDRPGQAPAPVALAMRSAASLIGIAKPRPWALAATAVLMPMTSPDGVEQRAAAVAGVDRGVGLDAGR